MKNLILKEKQILPIFSHSLTNKKNSYITDLFLHPYNSSLIKTINKTFFKVDLKAKYRNNLINNSNSNLLGKVNTLYKFTLKPLSSKENLKYKEENEISDGYEIIQNSSKTDIQDSEQSNNDRITFTVYDYEYNKHLLDCRDGDNLYDILRNNNIRVETVCHKGLQCGLCHCILSSEIIESDNYLEANDSEEEVKHILTPLTSNSRFSCQVIITQAFNNQSLYLIGENFSLEGINE